LSAQYLKGIKLTVFISCIRKNPPFRRCAEHIRQAQLAPVEVVGGNIFQIRITDIFVTDTIVGNQVLYFAVYYTI
jgi:hypothetical protein